MTTNQELKLIHEKITDTNIGYTEQELKEMKNRFTNLILRKYKRQDLFGIYQYMTKQEIKTENAFTIREMVNCCLIYGTTYNFINKNTNRLIDIGERYAANYANNDTEYTKALFYAQEERFKSAKVNVGVYVDNEGVSYNSVDWE